MLRYIILITITSLIFYTSNKYLHGNIENENSLGRELRTEPEKLSEWNLSNQSPFKYRILFSTIVFGTLKVFSSPERYDEVFYSHYYTVSLIMMILAVISFNVLMGKIGLSEKEVWLGNILLFISPPFFMAYTLPVHTREDMLGYTLLCLGLVFIIDKKDWLFCLTAIAGVLTRETLLILPFIYFFFTPNGFLKKTLICLLPALTFLLLRYLMGYEQYNISIGITWNLANPLEVLIFGFLCFHISWLPFFLKSFRTSGTNSFDNGNIKLIQKSAPYVFFLILLTTFFLGRFNEIRLQFLLFPWVIVSTIIFVRDRRDYLRTVLKNSKFYLWSLLSILLVSLAGYYLIGNLENFHSTESKYGVPIVLWVYITLIFGALQLVSIPLTLSLRKFE